MKLKRIIIFSIIIIIIMTSTLTYFIESKKVYKEPIVFLTNTDGTVVTVSAGIFRYGDINLDGVIDSKDIDYMELMINSKMTFLEGQKKLADFNMDGVVNSEDLKQLKRHLENNKVVKYNTKSKRLSYCVNTKYDSADCKWQKSNSFELSKDTEYYAFAKKGKRISMGYNFSYSDNNTNEEAVIEEDYVE